MTGRMLTDADVQAIAAAVAELRPPVPRLLDAGQVAVMVGMSEEWVRDHAAELGAVRLGDGKRGVLRFEAGRVLRAIDRRRLDPPTGPRRRPGPAPAVAGVRLLPLPDRQEAA